MVRLHGLLTGRQEMATLGGFLLVITLAALQLLPLLEGLFYFLAFLILTRILSTTEVRQKFPFDLWLLLTSAITMATALEASGIFDDFANLYHGALGDVSPYWLLIAVYFLTLVLTELITNAAAAALTFPLAYGMAQGLGIEPMPFIMAIAYAASASFISPYGYQTNLMVFNTGGYNIKHFFKVGIGVSITYSIVVLSMIPLVFPF